MRSLELSLILHLDSTSALLVPTYCGGGGKVRACVVLFVSLRMSCGDAQEQAGGRARSCGWMSEWVAGRQWWVAVVVGVWFVSGVSNTACATREINVIRIRNRLPFLGYVLLT